MPGSLQRAHVESLRDLLVAVNGTWSANQVVRMIAAMDTGLRRQDTLAVVRRWLGKGTKTAGRPRSPSLFDIGSHGPPGTNIQNDSGTDITASKNGATSGGGLAVAPPPPLASPSLSPGLLTARTLAVLVVHFVHSSAKGAGAREKKLDDGAAKMLALTPWLADLGTDISSCFDSHLRALDRSQRMAVARMFAAVGAGFRISEAGNKAKAAQVAPAIGRMARIRRFEDLTPREFLAYCFKTLELRGGKPFHSPLDIDAAIEYEDAK